MNNRPAIGSCSNTCPRHHLGGRFPRHRSAFSMPINTPSGSGYCQLSGPKATPPGLPWKRRRSPAQPAKPCSAFARTRIGQYVAPQPHSVRRLQQHLSLPKPGFPASRRSRSRSTCKRTRPCRAPSFWRSAPAVSQIDVIAATPLPGSDLALNQIPSPVQVATQADIAKSGALELGDFMNRRLNGVADQ